MNEFSNACSVKEIIDYKNALTKGVTNPDTGKIRQPMWTLFTVVGRRYALGDRYLQLYSSHLGADQWKHSMSSKSDLSAESLRDKIINNLTCEFDAALKDDKEGRDQEAWERLGEILHTIQDSYSPSHVGRSYEGGSISAFYDYSQQDSALHSHEDHVAEGEFKSKRETFNPLLSHVEIQDYLQIESKPGVKEATVASEKAIKSFMDKDRSAFRKTLEEVYNLSSNATVGTAGPYGKK